ncbi:MAG TPA: carboxylating nicotinate-nucleotide diphosphorylase [Candidatus Omnitrophota bacterium]|jgi:nicotinate-nucleotide pyrophosphorylase (carboxylating)|nr:carboxylating nicotinate-nucleotide diphosphorylase [Candidatus Omnitrophota bacterium]HPN56347.1 carboxylating nicotinate-nucleotide diphosphorylase [Candidatus Omnitrophota bacterium]
MRAVINKAIQQALQEDHSDRDVTTHCLVSEDQISKATIISRETCMVCGLEIITAIFRRLDKKMKITCHAQDGEEVLKNQKVISFEGKTRALLSGERVALNFFSYLSGIATLTNRFVDKVSDLPVKIMDTRKTIPGLRALVKMAVRCGGGVNHRFNLNEMVIIKDNHLLAYEKDATVRDAIRHVRRQTKKLIVVEVDTFAQFKQALEADPDIVLLDNMSIPQLKKAVQYCKRQKKTCLLEASGGINLHNVRHIALTGVDRISIGALTHSPRAIDFSMEFGEALC